MEIFNTLKRFHFWRTVKCEFLLTVFYVLFGCGASISANPRCQGVFDELKAAVTFGLLAAVLMQCALRINGPPQMNPAITLAMLCTRRIDVITATFHVIAQCLGGLAGAGILYGVTPARQHAHLGMTLVHDDIGRGQAFGVEFIVTFVVTFTYFACMTHPAAVHGGYQSLPVGLSVIVGHMFGWQFTGAGMNPARSLGPAVICNHWADHWVYWVGPILGAILGGITYEYSYALLPDTPRSRRGSSTEGTTLERRGSKDSTDLPTELTFSVQSINEDPEV